MIEGITPVTTGKEWRIMPTREEEEYLTPPVDIYETPENIVVVADLPGVEKGNIDIKVEEGILTIKGHPVYNKRGVSIDEEFDLTDYYRQFRISADIDQTKISADFKNGVLTVSLTKSEKTKPKKIAINRE